MPGGEVVVSASAEVGEPVSCSVSGSFHQWMSQCGGSIALTSYQARRLGFIGFDGARVSPSFHEFADPMGLAQQHNLLALATGGQLTLFANAPMLASHYPARASGRYDALYLPRATYHTGDLRIHDITFGGGEIWFVNTLFSCLATPSPHYSFEPRWTPPFISKLAAEDRCHLNGVAMIDGAARFVTALGETDSTGGWRANKASGGVLLDVQNCEKILRGLSMPHSPRWHQGKLWMLNSGAGELCVVDTHAGTYTPVCSLPGFLRGLSFVGHYALVGLSQIRQTNLFGGLPIKDRFDRLLCGICVIDLRDFRQVGMIEFTSGLHELYEVQFISGVSRPAILLPNDADARRAITSATTAYWLRPEPS